MLDRKYIIQNADQVRQNCERRGIDCDIVFQKDFAAFDLTIDITATQLLEQDRELFDTLTVPPTHSLLVLPEMIVSPIFARPPLTYSPYDPVLSAIVLKSTVKVPEWLDMPPP